MHGEVVSWKMTEEQRLAYIEKYPIKKPAKKRKSASHVNAEWEQDRKKGKSKEK